MTTLTTFFCINYPCETEATRYVVTEDAGMIFLCHTCAEAFERGQSSPGATLDPIEDLPGYQDEDDEEEE